MFYLTNSYDSPFNILNHLPKLSNSQSKGEKLPPKLLSIDVLHHNANFIPKI